MLAINSAALRVIYKGGLDPTNLQELYNTYVFIKIASISGYLPVTFTLFTLHRVRKVSWYLLILSIITVAVSTVTLVTTGEFHPAQVDLESLQLLAKTGGPNSCASMNPMIYCLTAVGGGVLGDSQQDDGWYFGTGSSINISNGAVQMLGWCLVVLAFLVGDACRLSWITRRPHLTPQVKDTMASYIWIPALVAAASLRLLQRSSVCHLTTKKSEKLWIWTRTAMPNAVRENGTYITMKAEVDSLIQHLAQRLAGSETRKKVCKASVHTTIFIVYIYWFAIFLRDLRWFGQIGGYSNSWSFGQIVAITVWVGPLCEYLHLEIRKFMSCSRVTYRPDAEGDFLR